MCLILFGYKVSKDFPLVFAANRDEFYQRPTAAMHFWESTPSILAGRDLEQGGTWFGVHRSGAFAALTNYRDPASIKQGTPSRGDIIIDFLNSNEPPLSYFTAFKERAGTYNGFNLLFGDIDNLFWFSNQKNTIEKIKPGIHGLSNRFLDTPWPKVASGKKALQQRINCTDTLTPDALFSILTDQSVPDDSLLPDTGVGLEWERILSPVFIQTHMYGTRSSAIMLMDTEGKIKVTERTYDLENNLHYSDCSFSFASTG